MKNVIYNGSNFNKVLDSIMEEEKKFGIESILRVCPEVFVDFYKADGSFRSMRCTKDEGVIDRAIRDGYLPEPYGVKEPNPEVVVVFDLDKRGWRSFRVDSVVDVRADLPRLRSDFF